MRYQVEPLDTHRKMNAHALAEPGTVEWKYSDLPVDYASAIAFMEDRVAAIRGGTETECVWLLEHPPLYTAGATAKPEDLLEPGRFPVHSTGRGGQYTYHGPGQRVAYVMLDLDRRGADVRHYVRNLETWLIAALARFGIKGETHSDRIGIWVAMPEGDEAKIAAIGVRIRRWVTYHGIALNVAPDLEHFSGIVPCGIPGYSMTSVAELGVSATMAQVDNALKESFDEVFGTG